jgi:ketosteroid isomerase-like protein
MHLDDGVVADVSVADQVAITQHVAHYAHCVDSGDGDGVASLYVDNGVFDMGHTILVGRHKIAEYAKTVPKVVPGARHAIVNVYVDSVSDGQATARAYLLLFARTAAKGVSELRLTGHYNFLLTRMDGGHWLFARVAFRAQKLVTES